MVKFNKEGIELIRNKINSNKLKDIGRFKKILLLEKEKWDLKSL